MNCDCKDCDPWMMEVDSTSHSSENEVIECDPSSEEEEVQVHIVSSSESEVGYSSVEEDDEEEDVYIPPILDDDELNNPPDPRLELVDNQFNLRMKELFSRSSSGQFSAYYH